MAIPSPTAYRPSSQYDDVNTPSFDELCKNALESLDLKAVKSVVATAIELDKAKKLNVAHFVPILRKALDTYDFQVLNLFFDSSLKDHFFVYDKELMIGINKEKHVHAYLLYKGNLGLIPDSIERAKSHTCWMITCIPPENYTDCV